MDWGGARGARGDRAEQGPSLNRPHLEFGANAGIPEA